ncbi:response regulator containing CheY-like receiver domain and AraC-type DNA-binding domain [Sulfurospirillum barnesii SES-3]|uniref:Response regulator containing CheY-like receiver domain and AraC-type DNA-binding domain n=1 Tax=Sulfurospirillum barnesii (strain ATCC 700032 / DSM 10660 / SES-3) TaxID=760154 RepID=I3XZK0_SULBS|nr:response regulator containing CheY-like receiver domain and AraC-type DNA-binding domain [Sulfurospirillum barnesii SES-3]
MPALDKMIFLVVDDSTISRKWLIEMIPKKIAQSTTIIEACDGEEALHLYETHRPDLVFLDITMPVVDGIEALERIKALKSQCFGCYDFSGSSKKYQRESLKTRCFCDSFKTC